MRVLIADDHEVVRKGVCNCNILKSRLNVEADIENIRIGTVGRAFLIRSAAEKPSRTGRHV